MAVEMWEGRPDMSVFTAVRTSWVVRNSAGSIVVILSGEASAEAARDWHDQGYRVDAVTLD